VKITCT